MGIQIGSEFQSRVRPRFCFRAGEDALHAFLRQVKDLNDGLKCQALMSFKGEDQALARRECREGAGGDGVPAGRPRRAIDGWRGGRTRCRGIAGGAASRDRQSATWTGKDRAPRARSQSRPAAAQECPGGSGRRLLEGSAIAALRLAEQFGIVAVVPAGIARRLVRRRAADRSNCVRRGHKASVRCPVASIQLRVAHGARSIPGALAGVANHQQADVVLARHVHCEIL